MHAANVKTLQLFQTHYNLNPLLMLGAVYMQLCHLPNDLESVNSQKA